MEYLDGTDLQRLVQSAGSLPIGRALHIVRHVLGSLAEAHEAGLVHRDIKPANIMVTTRGGIPDFVKVLDFGLVRPIENSSTKITSTQTIVGTPLYLAPEALANASAASPRSDVYAVAAVLYLLLSGRDAFEGATLASVISRHVRGTPKPLADFIVGGRVPEGIDQLLQVWMAKDPTTRPRDAREALAMLEPIAARYPWSEQDARMAQGEDMGHASTLVLHSGVGG
jgi:eukaryotic-like serine/threonine-protein kinase